MIKQELETIVALILFEREVIPSSLDNDVIIKRVAKNEGLTRAAEIVKRFADGRVNSEVVKKALEEYGS